MREYATCKPGAVTCTCTEPSSNKYLRGLQREARKAWHATPTLLACTVWSFRRRCLVELEVRTYCIYVAGMPWFGSGSSVRAGNRTGMYWVAADDGRNSRRRSTTSRRGRQNDGAPAPTGILKRSGRPRASSFQFEDGMVPQEMAAAVPMPSEQRVNAMFTEMVVRSL